MGKENKKSEEAPHGASVEEKARIQMLADRVKLLFGFCADLIPDIELLEKTAKGAGRQEGMAVSAAPLLTASGLDYEEANLEWGIKRRRAEALVNLIKVLDETEKERIEFKSRQMEKARHRAQIAKMFGI